MVLFYGQEAIGKLKIAKTTEDWLSGKFCAFHNFKRFKQLFEELETAWVCETEQYFDFQDRIDALNLIVKSKQDRVYKISDFKIINGYFECKLK